MCSFGTTGAEFETSGTVEAARGWVGRLACQRWPCLGLPQGGGVDTRPQGTRRDPGAARDRRAGRRALPSVARRGPGRVRGRRRVLRDLGLPDHRAPGARGRAPGDAVAARVLGPPRAAAAAGRAARGAGVRRRPPSRSSRSPPGTSSSPSCEPARPTRRTGTWPRPRSTTSRPTTAPSPVRHFWSLSAEEQFYVVWPLLVLVGVLLARRRGRPTRAGIALVLAVATLLSLACSIYLTTAEPGDRVLRHADARVGVRRGRRCSR